MSSVEDVMFKDMEGNALVVIVAGIGGLLLAPVLLPAVVGIGRPVLKSVIKTGLMALGAARESFAELREMAEDVTAEARAEMPTAELAREGPTDEIAAEEARAGPRARRGGRPRARE
jgi:hypothetical protein